MADDGEQSFQEKGSSSPASTVEDVEKNIEEGHVAEVLPEDVCIKRWIPKTFRRANSWMLRQVVSLRGPPYSRHIYWFGLLLSCLTGCGLIIGGAIVQRALDRIPNRQSSSFIRPIGSISGGDLLSTMFHTLTVVAVTMLSELTGSVHSTSLRNVLLMEGRLQYNSNIPFFTSSKKSWLHSWPVNIGCFLALISCYTCGTKILSSWQEGQSEPSGDIRYFPVLVVCGYSLIFFGIGLLLLAYIAIWSLVKTKVLTHSTNPLHVAAISKAHNRPPSSTTRIELSVYERERFPRLNNPIIPTSRQASLLVSDRRIRSVLGFLWFIAGFVLFLSIATATSVAVALKTGRQFVGFRHGTIYTSGPKPSWALIINEHTPEIQFHYNSEVRLNYNLPFKQWLIYHYLVRGACVGIFTVASHLAGAIGQASHDEVLWRRLGSLCGVRLGIYDSLLVQLISWRNIVFFTFKCLLHWLCTLSLATSHRGFLVLVPQFCYTALLLLMLAIFTTILACHRPRGPQPATYGHLQTLVDLVDEWPYKESASGDKERGLDCHKKMYWGDKGENADYTRRAGTAFEPLPPIHMNRLYYWRNGGTDDWSPESSRLSQGNMDEEQETLDEGVDSSPESVDGDSVTLGVDVDNLRCDERAESHTQSSRSL